MLRTKEEFMREVREVLEGHVTLDHPIFAKLMLGRPDWELLRFMTLQGYQLTKHFLLYIENLYINCPLPKHKRLLLHNLYEEETGRLSKTKNHVELMEDFIRAIGVGDEERDAVRPLPATHELIQYRMDRVLDKASYHLGVAAVMVASEGQNLETRAGQARHSVLERHYGLLPSDTLFFSVHQKEDVGHVREGISLLGDLCQTQQQQSDAIEAVDHTCKLFRGMYEAVERHIAGARGAL